MRFSVLLLMALLIAPCVISQELFLVTDDPELEVAGSGNLGDYLRSLGYSVTVDEGDPDQNEGSVSAYRGVLTDDEIAHLESFDLVIVHRSTSSGSFDDDISQWNTLQVPMFVGSAYLPRDTRWIWVNGGQAREASQRIFIENADHPIVAGLNIVDDHIQIFSADRDFDYLDTGGEVGNGELVASTELNFGTALAVWEAGGETPVAFIPDGEQVHTHRRVFFCLLRYHETDAETAGAFSDYTDDGKAVIARVVDFSLNGEINGEPGGGPSSTTNWELSK